MAILPSPFGSHANPMRGAGLKRCPFRQPGYLEAPTVAPGNDASTAPGMDDVPPEPPHCTTPLNGLPPTSEPFSGLLESFGSLKNPGVLAELNCVGSKLNACWYRSRYVPNKLTRSPRFKVRFLLILQSSWKYGSTILYRL